MIYKLFEDKIRSLSVGPKLLWSRRSSGCRNHHADDVIQRGAALPQHGTTSHGCHGDSATQTVAVSVGYSNQITLSLTTIIENYLVDDCYVVRTF